MANEDPNGFPQSNPPNDSLPKIRSIFDFTAEALEEFAVWLEQRGLTTPITQVVGFSQFTVQSAVRVTGTQTTTSTSYTNLATVGPSLTGLPNGQYLLMFGCLGFAAASDVAAMALSVNGAAVNDTSTCRTSHTGDYTTLTNAFTQSLSSGSNTVTAKYKSGSGGTATFADRWLLALKYANQ